MIPNTKDRILSSHGAEVAGEFGISLADSAHIMTILRDTLYSDKVLAGLREYSANAWDAHRDFGKADLPIKVTLPTHLEPTLSIRDFGPGLSPDDVRLVYSQYGASTKRNSDNAVGMLGIGSKSGFAYSDSFSITSWNGGMKRLYVAVLDKSEKGVINLMHEEPCAPEETGVEIGLAVRPEDIDEFHTTAKELYQYFVPRPTINIDIPELPKTQASLKNGVIYDTEGEVWRRKDWVAVMGCVSYRVDLDQLKNVEGGIPHWLDGISGALFFGIGEVQVNASREELKYGDSTKKALVEKFNGLVEEYVDHSLQIIKNGDYTPWERRKRAQVLNRVGLKLAEKDSLFAQMVTLKDMVPPQLQMFKTNKNAATSITVSDRTRLILRDDARSMKGFSITDADILIRRGDKKLTWDQMLEVLAKMCVDLKIDGIPILRTSTMAWTMPVSSRAKSLNEKHRQRFFKLKQDASNHRPHSRDWESVNRVPEASDVFVIIKDFVTEGHSGQDFNVVSSRRRDRILAKAAGLPLPEIYAYKSTEKSPAYKDKIIGIHYEDWRKDFITKVVTEKSVELVEKFKWSQVINYYSWRYERLPIRKLIVEQLGEGHPLVAYYDKYTEARKYFVDRDSEREMAQILMADAKPHLPKTFEAETTQASLVERYPLLASVSFDVFWNEHRSAWGHYVKTVDLALSAAPEVTIPVEEPSDPPEEDEDVKENPPDLDELFVA